MKATKIELCVEKSAERSAKNINEYCNSLYYSIIKDVQDTRVIFLEDVEIEQKVKDYIHVIDASKYYNYTNRSQYQLIVVDNSYPLISDRHLLYPNYYSFFGYTKGISQTLTRQETFADYDHWQENKFENNLTTGPNILQLKQTHILSNLNYVNGDIHDQGFFSIFQKYVEKCGGNFPDMGQLNQKEAEIDYKKLGWTINCAIGVNNSSNMSRTNLLTTYELMKKDEKAQREIREKQYNNASLYGGEAFARKLFMAIEGNEVVTIGGSFNAFYLKWMVYQYAFSHACLDTVANYNTYTSQPLAFNIHDPDYHREMFRDAFNTVRVGFMTIGTFEQLIKKKFNPQNPDELTLSQDMLLDYYPLIVKSESLRKNNFLILLLALCPCPVFKEFIGAVISADLEGRHDNSNTFNIEAQYLASIINNIYIEGFRKILFIIEDDFIVTRGHSIKYIGAQNHEINLISINDNGLHENDDDNDRNIYFIEDFPDINNLLNMNYSTFITAVNDVINIENYRAPYSLFSIFSSIVTRLKMSFKSFESKGPVDDDNTAASIPIPMNQLFVPGKMIQFGPDNIINYCQNNMFTLEYMTYNQQLLFKSNAIALDKFDSYVFIRDINKYKTNLIYEQNKANYRLSRLLKPNANKIGFYNIIQSKFDNDTNNYLKLANIFDTKLFKIKNLFQSDGIKRFVLPKEVLDYQNPSFFTRYNATRANVRLRDWYYYYATISDIVNNMDGGEISDKELIAPQLYTINYDNAAPYNSFIDAHLVTFQRIHKTLLMSKDNKVNNKNNENMRDLIRFMTYDTINPESYQLSYEFRLFNREAAIPESAGNILAPVYNFSLCNCIDNSGTFNSTLTCGPWSHTNAKIIVDCFKIDLLDYQRFQKLVAIYNIGVYKNSRRLLTMAMSTNKKIEINLIDCYNNDRDIVEDI